MRIGKYTFNCQFREPAYLPEYKGSTFRGLLGHALKSIICALRREKCENCLLRHSCIYVTLFEPVHRSKGVPPPPPYVIEPHTSSVNAYQPGDIFSFNLILFGFANDYIHHFICAFNYIGDKGIGKKVGEVRGRFSLARVTAGETNIFDGQTGDVFASPEVKDWPPKFEVDGFEGISRISITLLTPLRVKYENHLTAELPFHVLLRSALRRISTLYRTYNGAEPPLDYRGLVRRASEVQIKSSDLKWYDWRRYSRRQEQAMLMGGLIGSVSYEGELSEFIPYLKFCEAVHLGKQTVFGLGQIKMEIL